MALRLWIEADKLSQITYTKKRRMLPFLLNCSNSSILWTVQYMMLNSPNQKVNSCKYSPSDFSSCSTQNSNCCISFLFFHQILRLTQIRRVEDGWRFSTTCSCREGTGRLCPPRNESRVGAPAVNQLHRQFHCWCTCKSSTPKVFWQAQKTWQHCAWTMQRRIKMHIDAKIM